MLQTSKEGIMKSRILTAAMLLVSCHVLAGTTFLTGQALLSKMREWEKFTKDEKTGDPIVSGVFMGYVQGIFDANARGLCGTPESLSVGSMSTLVAKYLNDHPAALDKPASESVLQALQQAYPCPSRRPKS
jgi:hypothetical protein